MNLQATLTPRINEASLLLQLGKDYKAFKALHPERTARVPLSIKEMARDVAEGGATLIQMSEATGLGTQSIARWLAPKKLKFPRKQREPNPPLKFESATGKNIPAAGDSAWVTSNKQQWVKIRIDGRVMEIAREDFWTLCF